MRKALTTATELGMVAYWVLAGAMVLDWVRVDPSLMYSNYENPLVVAWNWSFFPIDIAFAAIGLMARFGSQHGLLRLKMETTAAVLMLCAGLMALSYWTMTGEFSLTWWGMNLWLVLLGLFNLISARPDPEAVA
jgi:hypothetical protein